MTFLFFFFFKQKTAYEITRRDWSSDVCSSDLAPWQPALGLPARAAADLRRVVRRRRLSHALRDRLLALQLAGARVGVRDAARAAARRREFRARKAAVGGRWRDCGQPVRQ